MIGHGRGKRVGEESQNAKRTRMLEQLRNWVKREVHKAEAGIDRGGPFRYLDARKEALLEVLERLNCI